MLHHTPYRRLAAAAVTVATLAATAPAAPAMPIDGPIRSQGAAPDPERIRVVRVQVDEGLDWGDTGVGAAGMLALVVAGFGAAHTLRSVPSR